MSDHKKQVLVIGGPTASGKSALGIRLAKALNGEIVNLDSVQVYRGLTIGSAKLSAEEMEGVPHHLLDIFDPSEPANVAAFRSAALQAIDDIARRSKLPILVGGSGMYLTVLLHGLADVPSTSPEIRDQVAALSREEIYSRLREVDPVTAERLNLNDTQRISRALEVYLTCGEPASVALDKHKFSSSDLSALILVTCLGRDELYRKIDARSQEMVDRGLIEETRQLLERHGETPVLQALGYKEAHMALKEELPLSELVPRIALHTRRFAKRQMTYWRNEPVKRGWRCRPGENEGSEVAGFDSFSERSQRHMKGFRALPFTYESLVTAVANRLREQMEANEVWYLELSKGAAPLTPTSDL